MEELNKHKTLGQETEQSEKGEADTNVNDTSINDDNIIDDPESFQNICELLNRLVPNIEKRKKVILTILWTLYKAHTKE